MLYGHRTLLTGQTKKPAYLHYQQNEGNNLPKTLTVQCKMMSLPLSLPVRVSELLEQTAGLVTACRTYLPPLYSSHRK